MLEKGDVRAIIFYCYKKGMKATEATDEIVGVLGEETTNYTTVAFWFRRFKNGEFDLHDKPRSGRPSCVDDDELLKTVDMEPTSTTRQLGALFGVSHTAIEKRLHALGRTWRYGQFVPHELTADQLAARAYTCAQLLTFRRTFDWLTNLVTDDEKYVLYVNHTRKRQWLPPHDPGVPTAKDKLYPKKVLLSVWWNCDGVVYWELLAENESVTKEVYSRQLDKLRSAISPKTHVYFHHDNAPAHTSKIVRDKIVKEFKWTLVPQPAYSPDIAPSDFHLFRSLAHHLDGKKFDSSEDLQNDMDGFFKSKPPSFFAQGIMQLPERWQYVVDNDGSYYNS